jgi:lantibiotic modifying enzyme
MLPDLDDADLQAEIDVALQTTLDRFPAADDSLCHGDLGNLDLLLVAARTPGRGSRLAEARRRASSVLERIERRGWACGTPLRAETPGLMLGLAGIGYGLLRLAEPDRVPSVLLLDPPVPG